MNFLGMRTHTQKCHGTSDMYLLHDKQYHKGKSGHYIVHIACPDDILLSPGQVFFASGYPGLWLKSRQQQEDLIHYLQPTCFLPIRCGICMVCNPIHQTFLTNRMHIIGITVQHAEPFMKEEQKVFRERRYNPPNLSVACAVALRHPGSSQGLVTLVTAIVANWYCYASVELCSIASSYT